MSTTNESSMKKALRLQTSHPSFLGAVLGVLTGVALLVIATLFLFKGSVPGPLGVAILLVGVAEIAVSIGVIRLRRVAWAFALSINGSLAAVLLFSAPRIRDASGSSLGLALLPALWFAMLTIFHTIKTDEF